MATAATAVAQGTQKSPVTPLARRTNISGRRRQILPRAGLGLDVTSHWGASIFFIKRGGFVAFIGFQDFADNPGFRGFGENQVGPYQENAQNNGEAKEDAF